MKMNINTKKYIEEHLKIQDKNAKIIDFKLNKAQLKLYDTLKKQKQERQSTACYCIKSKTNADLVR